MTNWQPTASFEVLKLRANIYAQIRQFFAERNILEVETPLMSHAGISDTHLASIPTIYQAIGSEQQQTCYLHTSPEYPMKRLLCAGSPSIYQLCKVFRNGEVGRIHNPEFSMLEWYRLGWDHTQLMDEVDIFLQTMLACPPAERLSYEQIFLNGVGINPHSATLAELQTCAEVHNIEIIGDIDRDYKDTWLQLIMSEVIELELGQQRPTMVFDFPSSQAALARIRPGSLPVAERFEVYYKGMELANGFHELSDADEQLQRLENDLVKRSALGLPQPPMDKHFIAALKHGLPDSAGVALGVDRLIMIAAGVEQIQEVISFPYGIA